MIRAATAADAAQIAIIWNGIIRDTLITFNPVEKTVADVAALIAQKDEVGHGFLVAEVDGVVMGFATYGQFRGGQGYRHAAEHTIVLADEARGRGLGPRLMEALEDHARGAGMHTLFAGVSAENPAGVAFHKRIGFAELAVLTEVGRKWDRWIDLVLMQKRL